MRVNLLSQTLTTALTAQVPSGAQVTNLDRFGTLTIQAKFTYGSGGTSATAWIQSSVDGGTTWYDVMCFALATTSVTKLGSVCRVALAGASVNTETDATLANNTASDGVLGDMLRVKLTTVGTYAGGTTLVIDATLGP